MIIVNLNQFAVIWHEATVLSKVYLYCFKAICLLILSWYSSCPLPSNSICFCLGYLFIFLFFLVVPTSSFFLNPWAQLSENAYQAACLFWLANTDSYDPFLIILEIWSSFCFSLIAWSTFESMVLLVMSSRLVEDVLSLFPSPLTLPD